VFIDHGYVIAKPGHEFSDYGFFVFYATSDPALFGFAMLSARRAVDGVV
jgi:hypothetical protein